MNVFLFHRDLRIEDNTGLNHLARMSEKIGLLFIFTRQQTDPHQPYFPQHSFNYMLNVLAHLNRKVTVNFIKATNEVEGLKAILKQQSIQNIFTNYDFTPFAQKRDRATSQFCSEHNIGYHVFQDYLLLRPGAIVGQNQKLIQIFTPFWRRLIAKHNEIKAPEYTKWDYNRFVKIKGCQDFTSFNWRYNPCPISYHRRDHFKRITAIGDNYQQARNILTGDPTSKASTAIKFGLISIREVVAVGTRRWGRFDNPFLRQVAWREFFYHTIVLALRRGRWKWNDPWNPLFQHFPWKNNPTNFQKWCRGETGYRLVDAAMHQLNSTGEMHNRARLVAASFLTKNLLVDWRWGANYFKSQLIDYDPIVNLMSWQWVAGCGLDAAPYFRIFNPDLQQQRFDPDFKYCQQFKAITLSPIVNWKKSREVYLHIMQELKQKVTKK